LTDASKTLNSFGTTIFLVILVEIVLLFGLNLYQKSRFNSLTEQLTTLRATLSSPEYQTINTQVEDVILGNEKLKSVLASKARWSTFYKLLNGVTPKDVQLKTINVTADGTFKADGETRSMTSLAEAIVAWNNGVATVQSPLTFVKLNSNGFTNNDGQKRVTFTVSGQVNMGIIR
jgi:hypothetical protein